MLCTKDALIPSSTLIKTKCYDTTISCVPRADKIAEYANKIINNGNGTIQIWNAVQNIVYNMFRMAFVSCMSVCKSARWSTATVYAAGHQSAAFADYSL